MVYKRFLKLLEVELYRVYQNHRLLDFIAKTIEQLYESWKYDKYIVDKYMLCRRIVDL